MRTARIVDHEAMSSVQLVSGCTLPFLPPAEPLSDVAGLLTTSAFLSKVLIGVSLSLPFRDAHRSFFQPFLFLQHGEELGSLYQEQQWLGSSSVCQFVHT